MEESKILNWLSQYIPGLKEIFTGIGGAALLGTILNYIIKRQEKKEDTETKATDEQKSTNAAIAVARITDSSSALAYIGSKLEKTESRLEESQIKLSKANSDNLSLSYDLSKEKQSHQETIRNLQILGDEFVKEKKKIEDLELQFSALADHIPAIIWTAEADGYVDYFNKRWFEYTGFNFDETEGWGWDKVLHPDDVQLCLKAWKKSLATGESYRVEYRFLRAYDSSYRWHLGRAFAVRNLQGVIIKWYGVCTDIEELKSLENLEQSHSNPSFTSTNILPDARKFKVLVAEDDESHILFYKTILNLEGYEAHIFSDGKKAIDSYYENKDTSMAYDLLILDNNMPEKTGEDIAREIRASGDYRTEILIVSAYAEALTPGLAAELHLGGVIGKPFQSDNFKRAVKKSLSH